MPNVTNFFEFLKEKYPIPFTVKIKLGLPITEEDLKYKIHLRIGHGDNFGSKIPEGLHFKGGFDADNYGYGDDFYLPEMTVDGDFEIHGSFTGDLNDVKINNGNRSQHRIAFYECNNIMTIPSYKLSTAVLSVKGCENFRFTPDDLRLQFLYLRELPELTEVGGVLTDMSINIYDCPKLSSISPETVCQWNFVLDNLPSLMELPSTLYVARKLTIKNCGIQKKYTVEELKRKLSNVREIVYE